MASSKSILLFDVDGTLTQPRQTISDEMRTFLQRVRQQHHVGVVGGSDLNKVVEQLGSSLDQVQQSLDFLFTENGLVGFRGAEPLPSESIQSKLGEQKLQDVINFCLEYIAKLQIPKKRGTFIEYRKGMINVSPIGRNCSQAEREEFNKYDAEHGVRAAFVEALKEKFADYGLTFSIGGQISVDIFPAGWDKTYCLKYLQPEYERIYFFGDKTHKGGNDHEIFAHELTVGHTVENPTHTMEVVEELLKKLQV